MKVHKNFPLSSVLHYKIGGKAKILLEASNKEDILKAVDFVEKNNIKKLLVIGTGANLLVSDNYFDGAVIKIVKNEKKYISLLKDGTVEAFAGQMLDDVIQFGFDHNLIGLEWAGGLPGTVGAGVRGNVGAFGGEIKDVFFKGEVASVLSDGLNLVELTNEDMDFSYRESLIKKNKNLIVSSVIFRMSRVGTENLEKAREIYAEHIQYRQKCHPLEYANCGSVFKNINKKEEIEKVLKAFPEMKEIVESKWHGKVSVAYLVGKLGFSGFQVGNAKVSEKHNNFIVNLGGATFSDVKTIIDAIGQKFTETFGFSPEVEIEVIS